MASELRLDSLGDKQEISQPPDFQVEDVTGKQLEAALQTEELLAVMFCEYQLHHCNALLGSGNIYQGEGGSDCSFKILNSWV